MDFPLSQHWHCSLHLTVLVANISSTLIIVSMTFEHFYSIIRPHKATSFNMVKRAKITIVCIVVFSTLYNIPHLFITANMGRTCFSNYQRSNTIPYIYYILFILINFAIPFVSILSMNSVIIHTLQKRSRFIITTTQGQGQSEGQNTNHKTSERQVYIMLLLVTFGFLVLTTPTYAVVFYMNFYQGNSPHFYAGSHLFYQTGAKLYYTNNGINFFFYVISGKRFQGDLMKLFMCGQKKRNEGCRSAVLVENTNSTSVPSIEVKNQKAV